MPLRPPPFTSRTREPSPIHNASIHGESRRPKCLIAYEKAHEAPNDHTPRLPATIDKLSLYRRARAGEEDNHPSSGWIPHNEFPNTPPHVYPKANVNGRDTLEASPPLAARLPKEMTTYIVEIEEQNRDLRRRVMEMQESLPPEHPFAAPHHLARAALPIGGGETHRSHSDGNGPHSTEAHRSPNHVDGASPHVSLAAPQRFASEAEREPYMREVLAQVEEMVQAHRNQSAAEILQYKEEAEAAQSALRELREAVALEGVDLPLLPVLSAPPSSTMEEEDVLADLMSRRCAPVVDAAAAAALEDLLRVEDGADVPRAVRAAVQRGLDAVARHLSAVVRAYVGHCAREVRQLHAEREAARREWRSAGAAAEAARVREVRQHEAETRALRDALHAFHAAAADGDALGTALSARACGEHTALLAAARAETAGLRAQLEDERSVRAATCLRLKASLQRRNAEFEAAVTGRAEEVLRARDQRIAELEAQTRSAQRREEARAKGRSHKGVQADMGAPRVLDETHFVSNVLSHLARAEPAAGLNQSFAPTTPPGRTREWTSPTVSFEEEEVWAKTMELLNKYGARGGN